MGGNTHTLDTYGDQVLLIVNTASKCGYTPQFEGLQTLYEDYQDQGLVVLAFPCNQFKEQDPEDNATIHRFCQTHFGVTFPVYEKVRVNGPDAHPLFKTLKEMTGGNEVRWNFEKFLVNRQGTKVTRYDTRTDPLSLRHAIEEVLRDDQ